MPLAAAAAVETVYRAEWGRIVASLIAMFHDFDLAEDCAQEAFAAAAEQWSAQGIPDSPRAWIVQTARHKAIDRIRTRKRHLEKLQDLALSGAIRAVDFQDDEPGEIPDERLRLIFTCCHPALALEAQVALTLRTLCGLQTEEIARAYLVPLATMAQRLVRAKRKIRDAGIPYAIPTAQDMAERVDAVLTVIYLVFNEGYLATSGDLPIRADLCTEAIRLGRLVVDLMPPAAPADERSEAKALVALMLLHDARRYARFDSAGELVTLEEQDRTLWNRAQIAAALPLIDEVTRQTPGPIALQAAIAALHCRAARAEDTDWRAILRLYDSLIVAQPSPVVQLNRAVALAMALGPAPALAAIDRLAAAGELDDYHLLHAARADLLRRLDSPVEAAGSYRRALSLVRNQSERRFLERRLQEVEGSRDKA